MRGGWDSPNRFYDDDVTDMFLGNNQGDIGVIHCVGEDEDENYDWLKITLGWNLGNLW